MKKKLLFLSCSLLLIAGATGFAIAAFGDKAEILGSSFSVGSADIKFLQDLTAGAQEGNLTDQLSGPNFVNISANWSQDYLMKIYNNATGHIALTSNANYETINDPDELRQIIYIEPFNWNDANNNGLLDEGELGFFLWQKNYY